jgi:hypothetical protein
MSSSIAHIIRLPAARQVGWTPSKQVIDVCVNVNYFLADRVGKRKGDDPEIVAFPSGISQVLPNCCTQAENNSVDQRAQQTAVSALTTKLSIGVAA